MTFSARTSREVWLAATGRLNRLSAGASGQSCRPTYRPASRGMGSQAVRERPRLRIGAQVGGQRLIEERSHPVVLGYSSLRLRSSLTLEVVM